MNLATKKAQFISKYKRQRTWPCGQSFYRLVEEGGQVVRHLVSIPAIVFENHRYETDNKEIALGLIQAPTNFARPWGWNLDIECIPEELREVWVACPYKEKAKLATALVEGKTVEEAMDAIDMTQLEVIPEKPEPPQFREECPVEGCAVAITGDITPVEAQQAMEAHVRTMHPEWKGENAEAKQATG